MFGCASNCIYGAYIITGLLIFNYPSYSFKKWHTTLLMWAWGVIPVMWNFYFRRYLRTVEMIGGGCMFVFFLASVIVLTTGLAPRSTSEFVFNTIIHDVSGWTNPLICWGIGTTLPAVML